MGQKTTSRLAGVASEGYPTPFVPSLVPNPVPKIAGLHFELILRRHHEIALGGEIDGWNSEPIRLAHIPAYVLNFAAKCRNRVQGDAGTTAAFLDAVNDGRLHAGYYASQACSASCRRVVGLFF